MRKNYLEYKEDYEHERTERKGISAFIDEAKIYYLATVDGDQPKNRKSIDRIMSVFMRSHVAGIPVVLVLWSAGYFLSNGLILRPKQSRIGRKEGALDERSSNEII